MSDILFWLFVILGAYISLYLWGLVFESDKCMTLIYLVLVVWILVKSFPLLVDLWQLATDDSGFFK